MDTSTHLSPADEWVCDKCTLENELSASVCIVCGNNNPSAPAPPKPTGWWNSGQGGGSGATAAALGAEGAASSAASNENHEATSSDGGEEVRDPVPDAKRCKTGGEHTGEGGTATAAGDGLSSNVGGNTGGDGGESKEGSSRAPLVLLLPEGYAVEIGKYLPIGSLTAYPSALRPVVAGDGIPQRILDFLLPATLGSLPQSIGVESVRGVSRGGWTFIERNLMTTFIDAMCSSAADADAAAEAEAAAAAVAAEAAAEWECDKCGNTTMQRVTPVWDTEECHWCGEEKPRVFIPHKLCDLYEKWLNSFRTGAPATGAEKMALCRGLQKKAVMINLVNELQVEDVNVDAPLKEWDGVTLGADGQVVKIDFSWRCKGGAYT
jgi:hypothetical protein